MAAFLSELTGTASDTQRVSDGIEQPLRITNPVLVARAHERHAPQIVHAQALIAAQRTHRLV